MKKLNCTGRFGLGFNSVYHFTDLPSFVTGDHFVMFDPHTRFLPGATVNQPGIKLKFVNSNFSEQFPDQFTPYKMFGCNFNEHFNGTLFRFPLRTEALCRDSEVKSTPCLPSDMYELLETFKASIGESLLFLKHLQKIEVYVQRPSEEEGAAALPPLECPQPTLVYCADVKHRNTEEWSTIADFFKDVSPGSEGAGKELGKDAVYLKLAQTPTNRLPQVSQLVTIGYDECGFLLQKGGTGGGGGEGGYPRSVRRPLSKWVDTFLVACGIAGGKAREMACRETYRELKMLPIGGVAAHLRRDTTTGRDASASSQEITHVVAGGKKGKAFCTLPLPVYVGLPVHIHAYFELSSNRRDIWYGDDMAGEGRRKSEWNTLLLQNVVCVQYVRMLELAKTLVVVTSQAMERGSTTAAPTAAVHDKTRVRDVVAASASSSLGQASPLPPPPPPAPAPAPPPAPLQCTLQEYYDLWPSSCPRQPWSEVVDRMLSKVRDIPLLFSMVLRAWVCPKDAVLVREGSHESRGALWAFFEAERTPVVTLPDALYRFWADERLKSMAGVRGTVTVTPTYVRHLLKTASGSCRQRLEDDKEMATGKIQRLVSIQSIASV